MLFQVNVTKNQVGVAILIFDKIDFKQKLRGKNTTYSLIYKTYITTLNSYEVHKTTTTNKQTLLQLKLHIHPKLDLMGDFNTLVSPINRSFRQYLNKEIL